MNRVPWWLIVFVVVLLAAGAWGARTLQNHNPDIPTYTVDTGPVTEAVFVSGKVEADNEVALAFPQSGRITNIYVEQGDQIAAGDILGTIASAQRAAAREAAAARVTQAIAARAELQNGQTAEERAVTAATVADARSAWEQTTATELQKIGQARTALFSSGLSARALDSEEDATAPVVSGSYTCSDEGYYHLEVYNSGANSGYSVRYTGLESGTIPATVDQPTALGDCGLSIQFTDGDQYGNSEWSITIPNPDSDSYARLQSAYAVATEQAAQNISAARNALTLAEAAATQDTAAPRVEALLAANAAVTAAQAELAEHDAALEDFTIYAPFAGTIIDVSLAAGEIARTEAVVTLIANDSFTLVARVPEIDIRKITVGQTVTARFDANPEDTQMGVVSFIAPRATEIDGVGYFETNIDLATTSPWLRAGLNADIEITVSENPTALRIPKRFIYTEADGSAFVYLKNSEAITPTPITIVREGTDGLVEISNLHAGDVVALPQTD